MFGAFPRWFAGRMQREAEECQSAHAGQRFLRLRLRRHPAAEGLAAGNQRKLRQGVRGCRDRGAHRGVGELRRIGALGAALHVGKLIAQCGDAALPESTATEAMKGWFIPAPAPWAST